MTNDNGINFNLKYKVQNVTKANERVIPINLVSQMDVGQIRAETNVATKV